MPVCGTLRTSHPVTATAAAAPDMAQSCHNEALRAQVTLFAVDKAWLQLLPYEVADLVAAFTRDWAPALSTGNTLEALVATSALENLKKVCHQQNTCCTSTNLITLQGSRTRLVLVHRRAHACETQSTPVSTVI